MDRMDNFEDCYNGATYESFRGMMDDNEPFWIGPFGNYNWPVWVERDEEREVIQIGVFMPRHGYCVIHEAPGGTDELREAQILLMRVWANRADAQFARYTLERVS